MAAINGVSGIIAPDGTVVERAGTRTRRCSPSEVGLVDEVTPGVWIGPWPGRVCAALTLLGLACRCSRIVDATIGRHVRGGDDVTGQWHGDRTCVMVVPTYDERDNLAWIVGRLHAAVPDVDVLVVDDGSPDGTGQVADELAADDDRVHVLHRSGKGGLGAAYLHGFRWALEAGYDVVGEMDADGSHQPEQLHRLLEALVDADLVIGSRWVPGGSVVNWPGTARRCLAAGTSTSGCCSGSTSATRPPASGCSGARRSRRSTSTRCARPGTCSRPTSPRGRCAPASSSARCRSSSSSGSAATRR